MGKPEERPSKIRKIDLAQNLSEVAETHFMLPASNEKDTRKATKEQENDYSGDLTHPNIPSETARDPPLSKSQLKKFRKQQQWEAGKEYRKTKRREKQKAKKVQKALERAGLDAKIANGEIAAPEPAKLCGTARSMQLPVTIILDCEFEQFMNEKEIISLGAQITRCYSENRSMPYRSHMVISSWGGNLKNRFETVLSNTQSYWKGVRFIEQDFVTAAKEMDAAMTEPDGGRLVGAFAPPDLPIYPSQTAILEDGSAEPLISVETKTKPAIVYLTSDSPHTLEKLSPNTSYIIGGIVDKNRHKGLCYRRACERGIPTAKLPIGKYMTIQGRSVLAVNHVMEIMLHWLSSGDWGDALVKVIPKRKEAMLKARAEIRDAEGSEVSGGSFEDYRREGSDDGQGSETQDFQRDEDTSNQSSCQNGQETSGECRDGIAVGQHLAGVEIAE